MDNMRKNLFRAALAAVVLTITLSGCGQEAAAPKEIELDVNKAAETMLEKIKFEDTLSPMDKDTALAVYGLDGEDVTEIASYTGSGATTETIALVKATEDGKARVSQSLSVYKDELIEAVTNYQPDEIGRLTDSSFFAEADPYIFLCISADTNENMDKVWKELIRS